MTPRDVVWLAVLEETVENGRFSKTQVEAQVAELVEDGLVEKPPSDQTVYDVLSELEAEGWLLKTKKTSGVYRAGSVARELLSLSARARLLVEASSNPVLDDFSNAELQDFIESRSDGEVESMFGRPAGEVRELSRELV